MQTLHPRSVPFGCVPRGVNLQVGTEKQLCSQLRIRSSEVYDIYCLCSNAPAELLRRYLHLVWVVGSQQSPDLMNMQIAEYVDKPRKIQPILLSPCRLQLRLYSPLQQ